MKTTVNRFKVNSYIERSSFSKGEIADLIGMKAYSLSYRLSGRTAWKFEELSRLAKLLRFDISDVINV